MGRLSILLVVLIVVDVHLFNSQSSGAEKLDSRSLKSVDEAISWVKARNNCKDLNPIIICTVVVELPRKLADKNISPGWNVRGMIQSYNIEANKFLIVTIERTRRFPISSKDLSAFITVTRRSKYTIIADGKIEDVKMSVTIENFQGQKFFDLTVPVSYAINLTNNEDAGEEILLLAEGFGIGWDFIGQTVR